MNQKYQIIIPGSLAAIAILSGAILVSNNIYADDVVDKINITVPVSCTLSGTGQDSHNATINNGQYDSAIGETTIKAFCNDSNGFAIYAIGYTDDTDGKNVLTSSTLGSTHDIVTGTATSGNTSNWAMKLSTVTDPTPTYPIIIAGSTADTDKEQGDPDFTTFQEVPDDYALVAKRTSGTDIGQSAEGATLKTTYQAYISKTQPAGTYTGQVKYTLVHPNNAAKPFVPTPCESGKICYNANANDVVGTMAEQEFEKERDWSSCFETDYKSYCYDNTYQVIDINTLPELDTYQQPTLLASNFSRDGYGFAGWNTAFDYNGTFYGPNETLAINASDYTGNNNGLNLYAVWVESEGSLQDSGKAATICGSLVTAPINGTANLSSVSALTDQRDNNTYAIAKLADGKCWMIENLRLADKDSNNNDIELSAINTNNPSLPLTNNYADSVTSNHLSPSTTVWCSSISEACNNQSMLYTNNTSNRDSAPTTTNASTYSYGNYYSWYSATAGNGTYSKNSGDASGDICPTGWTLPTSGSTDKDFAILYANLNSAAVNARKFPNNFLYSGGKIGSSVFMGSSSSGNYWSKSAKSNVEAYLSTFTSDYVTPSQYGNKCFGFSVRCLLKTN